MSRRPITAAVGAGAFALGLTTLAHVLIAQYALKSEECKYETSEKVTFISEFSYFHAILSWILFGVMVIALVPFAVRKADKALFIGLSFVTGAVGLALATGHFIWFVWGLVVLTRDSECIHTSYYTTTMAIVVMCAMTIFNSPQFFNLAGRGYQTVNGNGGLALPLEEDESDQV